MLLTLSFGSIKALMWTSKVLAFERNNFGLVKVTHPDRHDRSMQRCKSMGPQRISVSCCRWYSSVTTGFSLFWSFPMLKSILSSTGMRGVFRWPILFIFCFNRVTWIVGNSWQNVCKVNRTSICPILPAAFRGKVSSNTCSSQVFLIGDTKSSMYHPLQNYASLQRSCFSFKWSFSHWVLINHIY